MSSNYRFYINQLQTLCCTPISYYSKMLILYVPNKIKFKIRQNTVNNQHLRFSINKNKRYTQLSVSQSTSTRTIRFEKHSHLSLSYDSTTGKEATNRPTSISCLHHQERAGLNVLFVVLQIAEGILGWPRCEDH